MSRTEEISYYKIPLTAKLLGEEKKKYKHDPKPQSPIYYFNRHVNLGSRLFLHFCKTVVGILENKMHYLQNKMMQIKACSSNPKVSGRWQNA